MEFSVSYFQFIWEHLLIIKLFLSKVYLYQNCLQNYNLLARITNIIQLECMIAL